MKNNNFRNLCNNYSVCKNAKYMAIVPFVIVLVAVIVIVALGATSGSYSDAVGIGIDFEGEFGLPSNKWSGEYCGSRGG